MASIPLLTEAELQSATIDPVTGELYWTRADGTKIIAGVASGASDAQVADIVESGALTSAKLAAMMTSQIDSSPTVAGKLTLAQADARYQTGALGPLYGFFGKEAIAKTARCSIVMMGDSIMEGQGAPTIAARWVDQAQAQLRARFGPAQQGPGYIPAQYVATAAGGVAFPCWTYTGTVGNIAHGLGYKAVQFKATGATASITKNCTSFRLIFRRNSADVVTIAIDGGAPVTFTLNTSVYVQVWDSPALTSGSHTVLITYTSSGGGPSFCGGYFYDGDETAGVALWDGSHSGGRMVGLTTGTSAFWPDQLPFIPGLGLIVLGCATNDCRASSSGYSSALFKSYTQTVINLARSKVPNVPILLMPPYKPLGTLIEPWGNYMTALREIADSNPYVAFFDMSTRIPDLTSDPYSFLIDGVHPTALGHGLLAQLAVTAMSPN